MSMEDISARLGDVHKRLDDLRGEVTGRLDDFRADVDNRFIDTHKRLDDFRSDVNQRFADLNQRFTTLTWMITVWFSLLTILIIMFKFLKL